MSPEDPACQVAHGGAPPEARGTPVVVAVFATPVARHLTHFARHLGWQTVVVDPVDIPDDLAASVDWALQHLPAELAPAADVVLTDHHRDELGRLLRDALAQGSRWVGIMGSPRLEGPHLAALRELGVSPEEVARVHRPIGLDIGSHTPAEIALSTLAGLVADRNGRAGGLHATA